MGHLGAVKRGRNLPRASVVAVLLAAVFAVAGCAKDRFFDDAVVQTTERNQPADGDAGVRSGAGADCRMGIACDPSLVCDLLRGACVECIDDSSCSGHMPVGDAGAANGDTPICKTDVTNSSNNECVECTGDTNCGGAAPVCDETTNECTTSCTTQAECAGSDKPVCNVTKGVCVECENDTTCSGTKTQCNIPDNECVECIDDGPCAATGEVCDTTIHSCVQCTGDIQCANGPNAATAPFCDTEDRVCVTCLNDTQCTEDANSRCNPVSHLCTGCNDASQCEEGRLCRSGTCVECQDGSQCTAGGEPLCETVSGSCVECLDSDACLGQDAAHCITEQGAGSRYTCSGCVGNGDCTGKPGLGGLCRLTDGVCVFCLGNSECLGDPATSRCGNAGTCEICSNASNPTGCELFNGQQGRAFSPVCKDGEGCVECVDNGDCTGNADGVVCKTSNAGAAAGDADINTCVQCIGNANCATAGASRCSDNECVACSADADCAHIPGQNVCDGGTCVQCTGAKQGACGSFVCQSRTRTCSADRAPRTAGRCDDCVSDLECAADARCVQQVFEGTTIGDFCVPIPIGGSCATLRPYFGAASLPTLDTGTATAVCTLRQTSCPGLLAQADTCDQDSECGAAGVDDGLCVEVDPTTSQCTIPCDSPNDCPGDATCDTGCSL